MKIICPAILARTTKDYQQQINKVKAFAKRIQIDIIDGQFVDNRSINLIQATWPPELQADIHLMVNNPQQQLETLVAIKPNLVIIHAEASGDLKQLMRDLKSHQIKVGIAILPKTELDAVGELIEASDHLLIFGGHLGHMGGRADLSLIDKLTRARKLQPELEIGWDGGVNPDNISRLSAAGVNVFNVGGYIQSSPQPKKAYDLLTSLL